MGHSIAWHRQEWPALQLPRPPSRPFKIRDLTLWLQTTVHFSRNAFAAPPLRRSAAAPPPPRRHRRAGYLLSFTSLALQSPSLLFDVLFLHLVASLSSAPTHSPSGRASIPFLLPSASGSELNVSSTTHAHVHTQCVRYQFSPCDEKLRTGTEPRRLLSGLA